MPASTQEQIFNRLKKYYANFSNNGESNQFLDYIFESIAFIIANLKQAISNLMVYKENNAGFQLFAEENKLFLSGYETTDKYTFLDPAIFQNEKDSIEGAFYFDNVGASFEPLDILRNTKEIHKRRGTKLGITADIKRLCNTSRVEISDSSILFSSGWILDYSAPNFIYGADFYSDSSINLILLEEPVNLTDGFIINIENNSKYSDEKVMEIITHEFIPIGTNCYFFISKR